MFLWPKNTGVLSSYEQTAIHILHMTAFCALDARGVIFQIEACSRRREGL